MSQRDYGSGSIHQRGNGRWVGQINVAERGAKRRRKTVYGETKAEVRRKLEEAKRAVERGDRSTTAPRLSVWLDQWLNGAEIKPRTRAAYKSVIERHINPELGNVKINALNVTHVERLHRAMGHLSPTTVRNAHRVVSAALSVAMAEGRISVNPFKAKAAPAKAASRRKPLTNDQLDRFLETIADDPHESRWLAAVYLGMRQGECLGLTWDCVDFDTLSIDIAWQLQRAPYQHGCGDTCGRTRADWCPKRHLGLRASFEHRVLDGNLILQRPKTKSSTRVVPIPTEMIGPLRLLHHAYATNRPEHDHGLVWARPDGRPSPAVEDGKRWRAILKAAGIPHAELHTARNTAATLFLREGIDPKIAVTVLGHSDVITTQGYQNASLDLARAALARTQRRALEG